MERFYYGVLPRDELIFGTVAYVENCPAGFVVATSDSAGFMRSALYRQWPTLVRVLGTAILCQPRFIGTLWRVRQMVASRQPAHAKMGSGEILSLGVLPAYREARFVRQTGWRISIDLLESAVTRLCEQGVQEVRALVEVDNIATKLFYRGLGWSVQCATPSQLHPQSLEFVWRQ
jgi:ribosomal protein S18 acetylase RimI-like enzyme